MQAWEYFPRDHARPQAYRWGEDGLAGISDDKQNLYFALSLWNGKDPFLKERWSRTVAAIKTAWTGLVAGAMHLFATTTREQALELGKMAAFTEIPLKKREKQRQPLCPAATKSGTGISDLYRLSIKVKSISGSMSVNAKNLPSREHPFAVAS